MILKDHIQSAVKTQVQATAPAAAKQKIILPQVEAEIDSQAKRITAVIKWEEEFEKLKGQTYPRGTGIIGPDDKEQRVTYVWQKKLKEKLDAIEERYKKAIVLAFPELNEDEAARSKEPNFGELDKLIKEPLPKAQEDKDAAGGAPTK